MTTVLAQSMHDRPGTRRFDLVTFAVIRRKLYYRYLLRWSS
jgi:hypothetical protein